MRVAIIGTGIAGMSAAKLLSEEGLSVDIFEKSRGLGGRLSTKRLDWMHIDIGAQYFTARDPRFIEQVEQWQHTKAAALWDFKPFSIQKGQLLRSSDNTKRYVGTPRMNSIVHQLHEGLNICLDTRIHQISKTQGGWRLIDERGKHYTGYDWLISSAPVEQTQHLLNSSTDTLTDISEQLPDNAYLPCWALALATSGKVSGKVQGIFGDETISWVSRQSAKPGRPLPADYDDCWLLHFSSEWSTQHSKNTTQNLPQIGLAWLNHYLQPYIKEEQTLSCSHSYQHFWLYAKLSDEKSGLTPIISEEHNMAIIGDWCFGGRVEGSYLSAVYAVDFLSGI